VATHVVDALDLRCRTIAGAYALAECEVAFARGRTSILISHRFSTVRMANHIVVLDDGTVAEEGSHDELMALGGKYAAMFTAQAERYVDGAQPGTEGSGRSDD